MVKRYTNLVYLYCRGKCHCCLYAGSQTPVRVCCWQDGSFTPSPSYTHCHFPFQVNYVACSLPTVPYCHPHFARWWHCFYILTWSHVEVQYTTAGGTAIVYYSTEQYSFRVWYSW